MNNQTTIAAVDLNNTEEIVIDYRKFFELKIDDLIVSFLRSVDIEGIWDFYDACVENGACRFHQLVVPQADWAVLTFAKVMLDNYPQTADGDQLSKSLNQWTNIPSLAALMVVLFSYPPCSGFMYMLYVAQRNPQHVDWEALRHLTDTLKVDYEYMDEKIMVVLVTAKLLPTARFLKDRPSSDDYILTRMLSDQAVRQTQLYYYSGMKQEIWPENSIALIKAGYLEVSEPEPYIWFDNVL